MYSAVVSEAAVGLR
jgi:hypothetical protein